MDEKMLLQAIQQIVKTEIEPLNGRMDEMSGRMDEMLSLIHISCLSGAAGAGRLPGGELGSLLLPARDHRAPYLG